MRVKIIRAKDMRELEDNINKFLKDIMDDNNIIDIKYQGIGNSSPYSIDCPSVMVIMKT
jgi:hypothetical protein